MLTKEDYHVGRNEQRIKRIRRSIIVTATDDDGNEVDYQEVQRLDLDGKVFALLVEVTEDEEGGDAIIAASTRKTAKTSTSHRRTKSSTQPMQNSMNS